MRGWDLGYHGGARPTAVRVWILDMARRRVLGCVYSTPPSPAIPESITAINTPVGTLRNP